MRVYFLVPGLLLIAGAALAVPQPDGHGIVEQGSAGGAPACVSCHGPQLQGNDAIHAPAIAGKPAPFIVARLDHYASPAGHNPLMKQVASALSEAERQAVASYISHLPPKPSTAQ